MSAITPARRRRHLHRIRRDRRPLQVEVMEDRRLLATITVTGTGDTIADDGVVTLREAITAANANAASGDAPAGTAGLDTIDFDIPGPGVHTINLTSPLPMVTDPIFIDGFTQPGARPNTNALDQGVDALPLIELDGSGAGGGANGLSINAGNSTVRGLVIDQFSAYGIWLTGTGSDHIEGDFLGTDPTGMIAQGNAQGIRSEVDDVTIGGTDPAQRDVIAGNEGNADIESRGDRAVIQGNYVGIGTDGNTVLGTSNRVLISGSSNTVGGSTAGAGNVIANDYAYPLTFANGGGSGKTYHDGLVQGNLIGVNAAGTALTNTATAYGSDGIVVGGWTNLTIGGTSPGAANIIGGASEGIFLNLSTGVLIQGNAIGTDLTGALDFGGDESGYGVDIGGDLHYGGSDNNTIGGTAAGAGNLIENAAYGVYVDDESTNNAILSNRFLALNSDSIVLAHSDGVVGGNDLQAAPVLASAARSGSKTTITGTIDSTPDAPFTVQLYSSDTCCYDGLGPGQTLLGTMTTQPTDADGHVSFSVDVPSDIPDGTFVSATATDPSGNTSEFSLDLIMGHRLIVTNTDDSGVGSLRQAILCANAVPGTDTIAFDIPGPGVHTITPVKGLPTITDPVIIDGYTQPGASPNAQSDGDDAVLLIELDFESEIFSQFSGTSIGLGITAGNSTVRGLVINRTDYSGDAISLVVNGGNLIEGNFIGTDATGANALGNQGDGVRIDQSSNNTIGGTTPDARNIISGNLGNGVEISEMSANADDNLVQGNLIGTTAAGGALGNNIDGVAITGSGNTVGGSAAGAGNMIANNQITGIVVSGAQGTTIVSNTITENRRGGVVVGAEGQGTSILSNAIFANTYLGISFGNGLTPTPDDLGDADAGPNGLQNYPVITSATIIGNSTTVVGTLNSAPNSTFHLEFFGNDTPDASGFGEGQTFLGSTDVPTDANGNADFTVSLTDAPSFVAATATDPEGNTSEFSMTIATTTEQAVAADLSIDVTAAPDPLTLGSGNLIYGLTVTNHGPDPDQDVILTDTLPSGVTFVSAAGDVTPIDGALTFKRDTLGSGDQWFLSIEVTPTAAGTLTDSASVSGGVSDPDMTNNTASRDTIVQEPTVTPAPSADLSVTIAPTPDPLTLGSGDLTYTLTVTDQGPDPVQDVILTDSLPSGATFVSATGGVTPENGTLTFELGTLADGDQTTVTIAVTPTSAGTLTDAADVSSQSGVTDPDSDDNTDIVSSTVNPAPSADLSVAVTATPGLLTLGSGDLTYTLTVTNLGPDAAENAVLTDTPPTGATFVSATGGVAPTNGTLTFDLGTLADGARTTVSIVVTPAAAGTLTDSASVSGSVADPDTSNDIASCDATVEAPPPPPKTPDLAVSIPEATGPVIVGQELTYTITVADRIAAATQVKLTDTLPPGVDFVRATGGVVPIDGVLTFDLGGLAEGANAVMSVVVIPRTAGSIETMARVVAGGVESNTANNTATRTDLVDAPISQPTPPPSPGPDPGGSTPVGAGPTVVRLRRFGFHAQPTWFVIDFSGPLDPARAKDRANYVLTDPSPGRKATPPILIKSVVYDPETHVVMLQTKAELNLHRPYRLVVVGSGPHGLTGGSGALIDGDRDGRPGGDYVARIAGKMLTGRANRNGPIFGSRIPNSKPESADDSRSRGSFRGA